MTCVSAPWLQVSLQSSLTFLAHVFMADIILRTRNVFACVSLHYTHNQYVYSLNGPADFSESSAGRRPRPPLLSQPPESRSSSVSEQKICYSVMRYLLKNMLANRHAAHPFVASLLTIMCPPPTVKCSLVSATCTRMGKSDTDRSHIYLSILYIFTRHYTPSPVQPLA